MRPTEWRRPEWMTADVVDNSGEPTMVKPCKEVTVVGADSTLHYEEWVERLWADSGSGDTDRMLSISGMGLSGECVELMEELLCGVELIRRAGPMTEAVKKAFRDGREVDRDKFINEAGDILYYLVKLLHWQGASLLDAMDANQDKINIRYEEKAVDPTRYEVMSKAGGIWVEESGSLSVREFCEMFKNCNMRRVYLDDEGDSSYHLVSSDGSHKIVVPESDTTKEEFWNQVKGGEE